LLDYNYERGNLFYGGNEFRFFDIRSLRFLSANVRNKYIQDNVKHVELYKDGPRVNGYVQWLDFNGKRVIDNRDGLMNTGIESDYVWVHFTYISDKLANGLYIYGELSDWQLKEQFKMTYNSLIGGYEKTMLLKQAFYNYEYVSPSPKNAIDISNTEGNFFNTENEYDILLYTKNQFMQYDELVGTSHCVSRSR
jgi:hypothetical protein